MDLLWIDQPVVIDCVALVTPRAAGPAELRAEAAWRAAVAALLRLEALAQDSSGLGASPPPHPPLTTARGGAPLRAAQLRELEAVLRRLEAIAAATAAASPTEGLAARTGRIIQRVLSPLASLGRSKSSLSPGNRGVAAHGAAPVF